MRRQLLVLGAFLAACGVWRLSRLDEPEPMATALLVVGCAVLSVVAAVGWWEAQTAEQFEDDLILCGVSGEGRRTPIERAVAGRIRRLEHARSRCRLAADLRWRVLLAEGRIRPSPGLVRASLFPPLGVAGRRVVCEHADLLRAMADHIQRETVDPRVLVTLSRLLNLPPTLDPESNTERADEELQHQLLAVSAMLAHPSSSVDATADGCVPHRPTLV